MKQLVVVAVKMLVLAAVGWAQTPLVAPEGALAFPTESAGISAYVKTDQPVRITAALTRTFHRIMDVSDSHILGTVEVEHFVGKVYPHVYVDTQGWLVAFFLAAEPAALVMHWSGDCNTPTAAIKTTLEVALEKVATAARISLTRPSFYDFRYPGANAMLILLRVLPVPDTKVMYVKLPANHTLYAVSYYHYGCNYRWYGDHGWFASEFKINGALISRLEGVDVTRQRVADIPSRDFEVNVLHELQLSFSLNRESGSAGVALVLIYRAP